MNRLLACVTPCVVAFALAGCDDSSQSSSVKDGTNSGSILNSSGARSSSESGKPGESRSASDATLGSDNSSGKPTKVVSPISLVAVLASPEKFDKKLVAVSGYLSVSPTDSHLYLSEQDFNYVLTANAISVTAGTPLQLPSSANSLQDCDRHHATVSGVYHSEGNVLTVTQVTTLHRAHGALLRR